MNTLTDGYVTSIAYTYGYYKELNPNRVLVPFLQEGLVPPKFDNACELGFGQGLTINIHATGSEIRWYGTDFNYSQTNFARELAERSGTEVTLAGQSFEQFSKRDDLPEFNFIGLHGIWSWISDENQRIIMDFIDRKLAIGGVVYISYNTLPGWFTTAPLRHLIALHHKELYEPSQSYEQNLIKGFEFCEQTLAQSEKVIQHLPHINTNLDKLKKYQQVNPNYIAHEYLNQNWKPLYFSELHDKFSQIRLEFACSANYLEDFTGTIYTDEQLQLINQYQSPLMQQTIKDFILNRQFRRDYWVKGARKYNTQALSEARGKLKFMLITTRDKVDLTLSAYRKTNLMEDKVNPILDIFADYRPHFTSELFDKLKNTLTENEIFLILTLLYSADNLVLVQDEESIAAARSRCLTFNQNIISQAKAKNAEITYLISPLTGEGVYSSSLELIFLSAYSQYKGKNKLENALADVWKVLQQHGQVMKENGEAVQGEENNLAALHRWATGYLEDKYQILQRLEII